MDLKLGAALATLIAAATSREMAQMQMRSERWGGLGGQRSCLKVRPQNSRKPHQGVRECARRMRQMGFADDRGEKP
jgi:uncharacterized protein (DUF305 family)